MGLSGRRELAADALRLRSSGRFTHYSGGTC